MFLRHKHQSCKAEEGLQAQGEAPGLMDVQTPTAEEQKAASSSSTLIVGTLEEVPDSGSLSPPQSPQGASSSLTITNDTLWSQSNEASSSNEEEGPSTSPDPAHLESIFREALDEKVAELVHFLLRKYQIKERVTKAEMLESVIKNYKNHFPEIFSKASECMQVIFGIDVKEVDPAGHCYVLVTCLGLSYDGLLGDDQSTPKTGLLIIVLGMILMEGSCAPEEAIWEALSVMGLYDGREHSVYWKVRKLLTQEWVQENYLEYRQAPGSDPVRYEFLWGPRALAETSYVKVLEHVVRVNARVRISYPSLHEEALGEEKEGV
ncbi:melanoma-associated antigen 8 isoform X2 [Trachypithecus francoisi]|uniref:melanoma-associated antigen 8 isoform X2 n=1 Tax=Trachypithecus francoisi TaxID=54180 RepID=UPI00141B5027|nr:melanoma-associated antigen 8 isoform X2 [Trachypithecus francoisi]XP_033057444.1 melanoma-associated antigen 8 isoform X2 [Trachypithecus francoisi]XP_033057445.1 melanoma-associated antigen 8 isoform X2 [Trachypithecus francoisi]